MNISEFESFTELCKELTICLRFPLLSCCSEYVLKQSYKGNQSTDIYLTFIMIVILCQEKY
jgi:hypothetical protein